MSQDKSQRFGPSRRQLGLLLAAAVFVRPLRAAAAPIDVPGWRQTRWGMNREELTRLLGPARVELAAPLDYGKFFVRDTLPRQRIANRPFVVLFQLDKETERLAQVLARYRGDFPMMGDFAAVRDTLAGEYGAAHESRVETDYRGSFPSFWIEAAWRFPSTEVALSLVDQNSDPYSGQRKMLTVRYSARTAPR